MFDDFDRMISDFICEFGFSATYVRMVSSTPNDTTGSITVVTEDIPIEAIKMELVRPMNASNATKAGTLIQDGDQILYVRPTEKTDEFADALVINSSSDKVIINDVTWTIVTSKEYNPSASDCILYELYIRR